ncbi:hypothetical protein VNO77_02865 [Canavalia gladiata]|uniref:Uncharacterized protein n=1 Tax=Canavalia gladiata TaxID=3824 RepID=A0AAN9MZC3_CANGL
MTDWEEIVKCQDWIPESYLQTKDGRDVLDGSSVRFVETLENDLAKLREKFIDPRIASGRGRYMSLWSMHCYEIKVGRLKMEKRNIAIRMEFDWNGRAYEKPGTLKEGKEHTAKSRNWVCLGQIQI